MSGAFWWMRLRPRRPGWRLPRTTRTWAERLEPRLLLAAHALDPDSSAGGARVPAPPFIEETAVAGLTFESQQVRSVSWTDFNSDGFPDLWVGRHHHDAGENHLLLNQRDGTFVDVYDRVLTGEEDWDQHDSAWVDFDNDGDPDLLQPIGGERGLSAGEAIGANRFFVNQDGLLQDWAIAAGLDQRLARAQAADWADLNRDGLLDTFIANRERFDRQAASQAFLQTANGFEMQDVGLAVSDRDLIAVRFVDLTGDLVPDAVLSVDAETQGLEFYQGAWTPGRGVSFTPNPGFFPPLPERVQNFVVRDFNGDGFQDVFVVTSGTIQRGTFVKQADALLVYNPDLGRLEDRTREAGLAAPSWVRDVVAADFDNDMDVDLFLSSRQDARDAAGASDVIYYNHGDATFSGAAIDGLAPPGQEHDGVQNVAAADYNRDGFVDLFLKRDSDTGSQQLLRNTGNAQHWIEIDLRGVHSNRDAVGARVWVTAGGVTQVVDQATGLRRSTQDDRTLHFGLAQHTRIDEIRVLWPTGRKSVLENVAVDQILRIVEPAPRGSIDPRKIARPIPVYLGPVAYTGRLAEPNSIDVYRFETGARSTLAFSTLSSNSSGLEIELLEFPRGQEVVLDTRPGNQILTAILDPGVYYLRVSRAVGVEDAVSYTLHAAVSDRVDERGPLVTDVVAEPVLREGTGGASASREVAVLAVVSDGISGGSRVANATLIIPRDGTSTIRIPMAPVDGAFDDPVEYVRGVISPETYALLAVGNHRLAVRARDRHGNWGPMASTVLVVQGNVKPEWDLGTERLICLTNAGHPEPCSEDALARLEPLAPAATITQLDTFQFENASLVVHLSQPVVTDHLWIQSLTLSNTAGMVIYEGTTIGRAWGGTLLERLSGPKDQIGLYIRFNANATAESVQAVLRQVGYRVRSSRNPPSAPRSVDLYLFDSDGAFTQARLAIDIDPVNDPPTIQGPPRQYTFLDTPLVFSRVHENALTIDDPDAGSRRVQVSLLATKGTLRLATTEGLTMETGTDGAAVVFRATLASTNRALDGLQFLPEPGYSGAASVLVSVDDLGNTGTGGSGITHQRAAVTVRSAALRPHLQSGVLRNVSNVEWTDVTLDHHYRSMVILATPHVAGEMPLVTRIRQTATNSFQIKLQRAEADLALVTADVQFVVVEEGVYTLAAHGVSMEAVKYLSQRTDRAGSWIGEPRQYAQRYTKPVVVGQVMSHHDSRFSVFWNFGRSREHAPTAYRLWTGKHVGADRRGDRQDEVIGYLVVESGRSTLDGQDFTAAVGQRIVQGVGDRPPYRYSLAGLEDLSAVVVSQAGMREAGSWAVLYGADPATAARLHLALSEDRYREGAQSHLAEKVAYLAVGPTSAAPIPNRNAEVRSKLPVSLGRAEAQSGTSGALGHELGEEEEKLGQ